MAKIKKAQNGTDSTAIYKKRAERAGNKLLTADVRDFGKNISDFAKKQSELKRSENKGKPGYDSTGKRKSLSDVMKFKFKHGGPVKKAKSGASLKPVPADKEKSLGKLPTAVRNKMGYQKNGGKVKTAKGGAALKKQAATAIAMKKAGKAPKKMMGGGKCKYGC